MYQCLYRENLDPITPAVMQVMSTPQSQSKVDEESSQALARMALSSVAFAGCLTSWFLAAGSTHPTLVTSAAEPALNNDGSWSAELEFEKGHWPYDCWVVLALVPKSSVDLVQYFKDLPHHLSISYRDGRGELERHDEFNSLFGGIMPKGIQVCAKRKLHIAI